MAGEFFAGFLEALSESAGTSFRDARQQAIENARLTLQQQQGAEQIAVAREAEKGRGARFGKKLISEEELAKSNRELAATLRGTFKEKSEQELAAIKAKGEETRKTGEAAFGQQKIIDMLRSGRGLNNILAQMEKADEIAQAGETRGESAEIRAIERDLQKQKREFRLKVLYERDIAEQMNKLQTQFLPDETKRIQARARAKGEELNRLQTIMEVTRSAINAKPDPFIDLMLRERFGVRQADGSFRVLDKDFGKLIIAREKLRSAGAARVITQVMASVEGDAEGTRTAVGVLRDALVNTPVAQLLQEMKEAFPDVGGGPVKNIAPIQDSPTRKQSELDSGVKPGILSRTYAAVPEWARLLDVVDVSQYGIDPNLTANVDAVASAALEASNTQRTKGGGLTTGHHTVDLQRVQLIKMPFSKDLPLGLLKTVGGDPNLIKRRASRTIDGFANADGLAGPKELLRQFKDAQTDARSGIEPGDPINKFTIARLIMWNAEARGRHIGGGGKRILDAKSQVRQSSVRKTETFDQWWNRFAYINDLNADPDNPQHHFDYRGYYQAAKANPKAFSPVYDPADTQVHLSSKFKDEEHPTRVVEGIDTKTGKPVKKPAGGGGK